MARPRAGTLPREPHSLSLKVLRLSRPTLTLQHPIPSSDAAIRDASLLLPKSVGDSDFILTPSLSLPSAFGAAFVGEAFSCSLCANNELQEGVSSKIVSHVQMTAEMQTPSQTVPLSIASTREDDATSILKYGATKQEIVQFDLKEEGPHVLTVSLTYTESSDTKTDGQADSRVRTFRKLYQFQAHPCLSIRTKATELSTRDASKTSMLRFVLEAQIENLSDDNLNLQNATFLPHSPFTAKSLNWDVDVPSEDQQELPFLSPRDVYQIAFMIDQDPNNSDGLVELRDNLRKEGRVVLGQVSLVWTRSMGQTGQLTTSNLLSRRRQ